MESTTNGKPSPVEDDRQDAPGLLDELSSLRTALDEHHEHGLQREALADSLETAYEELRVADEAVLTTDSRAVVRTANPSAQRLLGLARQRMVGKPAAVFVDTDDRARLRETLAHLDTAVGSLSCRLTVVPRGQEPLEVDLLVAP